MHRMKLLSNKLKNIKNKIKPRHKSTEFAGLLEKGECCECLILLLPLVASAFPALGAAGLAGIFDWDELFGNFDNFFD